MNENRSERDVAVQRLMELCAVDTTTGQEAALTPTLRHMLEGMGARVTLQRAQGDRDNVLATWSHNPRLLFSTHTDTVPPFLPPHRDDECVYGRGSIDAKGQIVAQWAVIERLLAAGARDLAWLGVVGEETDSLGAKAALSLAPSLETVRAVVNGEPTGNQLATGQRGVLHLRLSCRGRAGHSSTPSAGRSAIWPLLDWLQTLRSEPRPSDPDLGDEIWNLASIGGGRAPNVIPDAAHAELFVRALPGSDFATLAQQLAPEDADVEILSEAPADRFPRVPGFAHSVVPFGSDAPRLRQLARSRMVALIGPGDIELAHSADERLRLADLDAGIDLIQRLAERFLREPGPT
ncbi:MAG: M20/M25/M40 family metallo-hydrolase [Planctomycetota bacterium]